MNDERFEGMSESARALLTQAGGPRPRTAAERARTAAAVGRIAAAPVVAGGAWLSWKGALLAAALVAGGLGVSAVARREPTVDVAPRAAVPAATAVDPAPRVPDQVSAAAPAVGVAPAERAAAPVARVPARPARVSAAPTVDAVAHAAATAPEVEPAAVAVGGGGGGVARPAEDELRALERARSMLGSDPAEALRIVDGAGAAGGGGLGEEREVIAVEALHRMGRTEAMRQRAEGFLRRWPRSLYAERVRRLLGT